MPVGWDAGPLAVECRACFQEGSMDTRLSETLGQLLLARGQQVATAESCTGGMISAAITDVSGSSSWFERGFVVYSNEAKTAMLGVPAAVIAQHGAVSELVVRLLAANARQAAHADWAVAVSGVAGPTGGSLEKPVGTVWFAWAGPDIDETECCCFAGDRASVRSQTVDHALTRLIELIEEKK